MNNLITKTNQTMSSLEIAKITKHLPGVKEKQHNHICRDIRKQLEAQNINQSIFGSVYLDSKNENRNCFELDYEQTMILISGYSIKIRAAVIERWLELEGNGKSKLPDFNNPAEAARAWADQYEKRELAEHKVSLLRPRADFAKKALRDQEEHYSITQAGKHLGIRQKDMFVILRSNKLLTKENLPTQKAIDQEILILRSNPDCGGRNRPQAIMTMQNIYNFNERYNKFELKSV